MPDKILDLLGIDRKDEGEKSITEDIRDSIRVGLFNIDNIKEDVDKRMDKVDRKLDEVEELEEDARDTLIEVEEKIDEIDVRVGILEAKLSGAVILGLLYLAVISLKDGRVYIGYSAIAFAIIFALETVLTLYRGFVSDFFVKYFLRFK